MKDFEIRCDESRLETTNLIYGKFTLGPFLPGQATTFGNALRRSLLAELSGLAITAFEIIGVMQEFSTLPGLRESILDLSLNLKQIVLTGVLPHSTPPIGFLHVRGPAIIKAIDLKLPVGVYCASPNQYIATLGSNGMLHLKFVVSVGKGYSIQPYSVYRSLSKVKLQPSSNFDNTILGAKNINYAKQVGYESFKDVNLSSTPVPLEGKETNLANKETVTRPTNSKELYVENKNSIPSAARSEKALAGYKGTGVPIGVPDPVKGKEFQPQRNDFFSKKNNSYASEKKILEKSCVSMRNSQGTPSCARPLQGTGVALAGGTPKELALSSKAFPSTFLISEKNSNSSYINIQTQLFQRITPHQVLPIDAVFTPVSQVNFLTEVNDRFETARENIVLEIWTNGSIHPKRALEEATLSLVQNFDTLLKKIQQASSFYKGLRYWTYLQPFKSSSLNLGEKTEGFSVHSVHPNSVSDSLEVKGSKLGKENNLLLSHEENLLLSHKEEFEDVLRQQEEPLLPQSEQPLLPQQEKLFKKDLPQSIYNLDIGNLNLSLQTFIFLKKAKIHTLLQLLTQFSLKQNNILFRENSHLESNLLNEKIIEELNNVIKQFGSQE